MTLRFLLLEDIPLDAQMVEITLLDGGIDCELLRVETRSSFVAALETHEFDLILADYILPGFDGISALEIARTLRPDVPFIFVSGSLGEELAIEALKRGATDYVLKQRLGRLVPCVQRALQEAQEHRQLKRAEGMLIEQKQLLELTAMGRPLEDCLFALCASVSKLNPGSRACILLVDDQQRTFIRSIAPDFPPSFGQELQDAPIHEFAIGCSTAVYCGEPVTCADIANDDRWSQEWRNLCLVHGILAWHSAPILGVDNLPLGSLMLCFNEVRMPTEWEQQLADFGTHIASIVFERDRSSLALRQSETRFRRIFDCNMIGMGIWTQSGGITEANDALLNLIGYTRQELEAGLLNWRELTPPEHLDGDRRSLAEIEATGVSIPFEKEYIHKSGRRVPILIGGASFLRTADCGVFFAIDLTERKRSEAEREQLLTREQQYTTRLRQLNRAALALNAALSIEEVLNVVTEQAYQIIGTHQSVINLVFDEDWLQAKTIAYLSDKYAQWRGYDAQPDGSGIYAIIAQTKQSIRMTQAELEAHPRWRGFSEEAGKHPPLRGWLAAPLVGRKGQMIGLIQLSDKYQGEFTEDDEAILVQLAQMASVAVENARLYEAEQQARSAAEIAREEAESANRIKDEFLAVLSHELRSPLNPILGWANLLRNGRLDATKTAHALETIERNAKLQVQLIEDLLDVSRILRGKMSLNITPVNLAPTIEAAIETVRLAAEAKRIDLRFEIRGQGNSDNREPPDVPIKVMGDSARLQQVVWNLLTNAIKFTPHGGRVEVKLEQLQMADGRWQIEPEKSKSASLNLKSEISYAQITVTDTGKGIDSKFLPYVFEYFRQEDGKTTRRFGGLGLGLAIVRHLVEQHSGTVKAESPGEEQGATFTVRLPLMPVKSEPVRNEGSESSRLTPHASLLTGLRIVTVDDEADIRELVAFILERAGAEVRVAASAVEVLTLIEESLPDVLLCDIGMPEVDGYMLMRQIRALSPERGEKILAIALTAYAGEVDYQQAMAAGFQMHVSKPVEPEVLVQAIARLCGRNRGRGA